MKNEEKIGLGISIALLIGWICYAIIHFPPIPPELIGLFLFILSIPAMIISLTFIANYLQYSRKWGEVSVLITSLTISLTILFVMMYFALYFGGAL